MYMCAEMEEIGAQERQAKKKALFEELKAHMEQTRTVRAIWNKGVGMIAPLGQGGYDCTCGTRWV